VGDLSSPFPAAIFKLGKEVRLGVWSAQSTRSSDNTTAELLIAAKVLVTGKNKPVTGNHNQWRAGK
jgi:hypothetical protein